MTLDKEDLESLIRRYVILGKKSPKGYEVVKCAKCNDYKVRGGFKFENETVEYHCFNCSTHAKYDPSEARHSISKKMREVLVSFGIPDDEITKCISLNFFKEGQRAEAAPTESKKVTGLPTKEIKLPHGAVLVSSGESPWCAVASAYLATRSLDSVDFPFYVTDETAYAGRLLIPYFLRGKIIYWQGRSLDDEVISPRYKNPSVEKDNIFFNMDELYRYTEEPLFVVEGPLDALSIGKNSIATLGSTLTEFRLGELRKAAKRRRIIFVIDKNLNGYKLGLQVLSEGWEVVTFPDNLDDSNDARKKCGQLWLVAYLTRESAGGFAGKVNLEVRCKKD